MKTEAAIQTGRGNCFVNANIAGFIAWLFVSILPDDFGHRDCTVQKKTGAIRNNGFLNSLIIL